MYRRPRAGAASRHSAFARNALKNNSVVRDLLYRFELSAVLESQAVSRAAASPHADLRTAREVLASLDRAISRGDLAAWGPLEMRFHRAVNEQSGNLVLASLAERTQREVHDLCAPHVRHFASPQMLPGLQSQHASILSCIETGQAELAVQHTRSHLHVLREQVLMALVSARRYTLGARP